MTIQHNDLTIDEALTDPMIRSVMKADRVDPRALEAMLRGMASLGFMARGSEAKPSVPLFALPSKDFGRALCGSLCA